MKPTPAITLPLDLSPEAAPALFDIFNELAELLWQHYELEITEWSMQERNQYPANQQALDFDDDLPF